MTRGAFAPAGGRLPAGICACSARRAGDAAGPNRKRSARWLGGADEVPEFQRRAHIHGHYRLEAPRLRHFWRVHNEAGSIWTHALAGLYMLYHFGCWLSTQEDLWDLAWPRTLYFCGIAAYFVTSFLVFAISVQYHWRICSPEREFLCWRCLDQSACLALVVVGFFAGIPMGFHCHPGLRQAYAALSVIICAAMALLLYLIPKRRSGAISAVIILGTSVAMVPAAHWLWASPAGRRAGGQSLGIAILLAVTASAVFTKCFPECVAPGRFDLVGSSHQIWHVLIFYTVVKYADCLTSVFALTSSQEYCA